MFSAADLIIRDMGAMKVTDPSLWRRARSPV